MNNETISVVESKPLDVEVYNQGRLEGIGIASGIGLIAFIGFVARGLFIYYLKYEAPKDRPINSLMFYDQVRPQSILQYSVSHNCYLRLGTHGMICLHMQIVFLSGDTDFINVCCVSHDNSPHCHPNTHGEHFP